MGRHTQTLSDSRRESYLDIPDNRDVFYDYDKMEIDIEVGVPVPGSIVVSNPGPGKHSPEHREKIVNAQLKIGMIPRLVDAEVCTAIHHPDDTVPVVHFVRHMYVSGYIGEFSRTYVWDENH